MMCCVFFFFRFKFGEKIPLYCFARVTIQTLLGKLEMLVYNRIYFKKMVHLTLIQLTMKHWYLYLGFRSGVYIEISY